MSSISSTPSAQRERFVSRQDKRAACASLLARAIREPLVHFLLAGFALFVLYALLQPERFAVDSSRRIELSPSDIARVELAFAARWQRQPNAAELRGLLAGEVRNEILSREAIALGLDKDDVIVKRRLAQKMEFLSDDVSGLPEPTPEELRTWFDANKGEFAQPSRITFRHVYYSPDRRGVDAEPAARRALASADGRRDTAPRGDIFMFQDHYADRTQAQLAQVFGSDFATAVFFSPPNRWSGPLVSGLGWHIVWTEELRTGEVPAYEDVESDVRERWTLEQRDAAKRARFEAMLARYEIVMPDPSADTGTSATRAAPVR